MIIESDLSDGHDLFVGRHLGDFLQRPVVCFRRVVRVITDGGEDLLEFVRKLNGFLARAEIPSGDDDVFNSGRGGFVQCLANIRKFFVI